MAAKHGSLNKDNAPYWKVAWENSATNFSIVEIVYERPWTNGLDEFQTDK